MSDLVRVPIIRKAVKLNYKQRLSELSEEFREIQILDIIDHYEMLARDFKKVNRYRALGNKGKQHRNWVLFEKFYDMCCSNGYNAMLYLDLHFKKAKKYWTNGRYPLPNMLLGEKARSYYEMAVKDLKEKYVKDVHVDKKIAAKQTMSMQSQVLKSIADSANTLKFYMNTVKTINSPEYKKAAVIYSFWSSLSPYYLYSVEWFREYVSEVLSFEEHSGMEYIQGEFARISRSRVLQRIISDGVSIAESELNIPKNIDIMR